MNGLIAGRLLRLCAGMVATACLCTTWLEVAKQLNMAPGLGFVGSMGIALCIGLMIIGGDSHP